jgi:hypothetical protein
MITYFDNAILKDEVTGIYYKLGNDDSKFLYAPFTPNEYHVDTLPVIKDRTTGILYRFFISDGLLGYEIVTEAPYTADEINNYDREVGSYFRIVIDNGQFAWETVSYGLPGSAFAITSRGLLNYPPQRVSQRPKRKSKQQNVIDKRSREIYYKEEKIYKIDGTTAYAKDFVFTVMGTVVFTIRKLFEVLGTIKSDITQIVYMSGINAQFIEVPEIWIFGNHSIYNTQVIGTTRFIENQNREIASLTRRKYSFEESISGINRHSKDENIVVNGSKNIDNLLIAIGLK